MQATFIQTLAADCGGELRGPGQALVLRVSTDSRQVQAGDLFVCLSGPRFDGHAFAAEAVRRGAVAVLGEAGRLEASGLGCPVVLVADARAALGQLAAAHRQRHPVPVVAVAGSNGKTTTKELLAAVLRRRFHVLASEASFNNDIGVPMTLLQLDASHEAAVVEVGTNHPGELAPLLRLIRPTLGVLTRLGREHLEFFGDMNGVVAEEGTLADFIPATGVLCLVGESIGSEAVQARARARVVRVGWAPENDWSVRAVTVSETGTVFQVSAPRAAFTGEYRLRLLGRHQAENALLTVAAAEALGLERDEIESGLADCLPARRRLQWHLAGGVGVLDDSYNANADSTRAALATLRDIDCPGRRFALLGDMAELGEHTAACHAEVGRCAAASGLDGLFLVGRWAPSTAAGAREAGLAWVQEFGDATEAAEAVLQAVQPGDRLLVKASRAARLDVVADQLRQVLGTRGSALAAGMGASSREVCSTT